MNNIIDVWAQITTDRMMQCDWMETLLRWSKDGIAQPTVKSTCAEMDKAETSVALLSAWYGPQGALISNDEVAEQIAESPSRFRGLASADIRQPLNAVKEIRKWLNKDEFVGVRIVPWLWGLPPDDRHFYPIYTVCAELGVPVCTQVGHTGPLLGSEYGRPIPYLENVLLDFPELTVVGGHVGFPWIDELFTLTIKFPNFYVDTSAYALHRLPSDFVTYMKSIGDDRVMFGTNWPMISHSKALNGIENLALSEMQKEAFLYGNANKVFEIYR